LRCPSDQIAHDLSEQAVEPLRLHPPLGDRALALRDEQRAVAAEDEAAAEMRRRSQRRPLMIGQQYSQRSAAAQSVLRLL
jgi:hypothetical protein